MGNPHAYLRERLAKISPQLQWHPGCDAEWVRATRKAVSSLIGCVNEPWPDSGFEILNEFGAEDHTRLDVRFPSRAGWAGTGWLLIPHSLSEPAPGVVCLPGHGRGADAIVGLVDEPYQANIALECVRRGWITMVVEQVSFGRNQSQGSESKGSSCLLDSMMCFSLGESMIGWRVRDAMAAIRALCTHSFVDSMRIGTLGISGGGLTSLWTAALDPTVLVAGVSGYFTPMSHSIHMVDHCPDNYAAGIAHLIDVPDLAGLVAPRWLATENGTLDTIFHIDGYRVACDKARSVYAEAGMPHRFSSYEFDADHEFRGSTIFDAFEQAFKE